MPSTLMRKKTNAKLSACESSLNIPRADSAARRVSMKACTNAGSGNSFVGSGGIPREIDERDAKTVV
jgi:hypothetical protein